MALNSPWSNAKPWFQRMREGLLPIEDEKAFIEKMERQAEMVEALGLLRQEAGPGQ